MKILFPIGSEREVAEIFYVHAVGYSKSDGITYSICMNDQVGELIVAPALQTQIVDSRIPHNWRVKTYNGNFMQFAPREINEEGFHDKLLEPDRYPEACNTVLRLQDPLRFMQIPVSFLLRIKDLGWSTVDFLRKNKWVSTSAIIELAISKVQNDCEVSNEVVSIAALLPKDESQIEEHLEVLSKVNAEDPEQKGIVFAALLAYVFEARDDFDDVIQVIEDLVGKLGIPDAFETTLGSGFLDLPPNVLMKTVKRFLESAVYMKLVER